LSSERDSNPLPAALKTQDATLHQKAIFLLISITTITIILRPQRRCFILLRGLNYNRAVMSQLGSNQRQQSQGLLCYHYTIGQFKELVLSNGLEQKKRPK
jgi:hypothetical protein